MNPTRSGCYIQLHKTGGAPPNQNSTWLIPYSGDIGLSVTQTTRQPVKEFFKEIGDAIISLADTANSTVAVGLSFARDLSDLTGIKFMNKGYYTTAWVGEEPATFTAKLDFFRGWMGKWNANIEVFTPIMQIMKQTVPNDITSSLALTNNLTAPMTTSLEAFAGFAGNVLSTALSDITAAASTAVNVYNAITPGSANNKDLLKELNTISGALRDGLTINNNTWTVSFGWSDGNTFSSFFAMNQLIVIASSFSFSNALEQQSTYSVNSGYFSPSLSYYPISGTVNLTFKTQNLLASSQFGVGT
jgi:hypothetical protein